MAGAQNTWMILTFAPPLACASVMAGVSLLIGLMGADYPDAAREWLASIGSNLLDDLRGVDRLLFTYYLRTMGA